METNTVTTREKAEQLINTLQGEALLVEIDRLLGAVDSYKKSYDSYCDKYWKASAEISNLRNTVREYFKEQMDGDKDATVNMDLDDINNLLGDIGAAELQFTYSAEVTIKFTITGVVADNKDDAERKILDAISYRVDNSLEHNDTEDDNYEVENVEEE